MSRLPFTTRWSCVAVCAAAWALTFLHPAEFSVSAAQVPAANRTAGQSVNDDSFVSVADPFTPPVSYSLRSEDQALSLTIKAGAFGSDSRGITVNVGISAGKVVRLTQAAANATYGPSEADFTFSIRNDLVGLTRSGPRKVRLAFALTWSGGPYGTPRLQQRFLEPGQALAGSPSADPGNWTEIDLDQLAQLDVARKQRVWIDFQQPMEGKASIVIEDAHGNRVRNLVSGAAFTAGAHRIEWDGLDDLGSLVAAGTYHWRAVSHPGITPHYLFSFYNSGNPTWRSPAPSSSWLADHSNPVAAASSAGRIYLAAPLAESGHSAVMLTSNGDTAGHVDFPPGLATGTLFLLADDTGFYALEEGTPARAPFHDVPGGGWTYDRSLSLLHWDLQQQPLRYDGPRGEKVVRANPYQGSGPHLPSEQIPAPGNLAGAAVLNHRIYISLANENQIVVLDSSSGAQVGEVKLPKPGLLAADGTNSLIAFSGNGVVRIDVSTSRVTQLFVPALSALPKTGDPEESLYGFVGKNPTGIAVDAQHNIYLSDNGVDQDIKVFSSAGRMLREIGAKGGRPLVGPWTNGAVYRPHGIAIDDRNQLWVTETDTYPRRISVWNAATGQYLRQYLGPANYGAPEGSFDRADHTRWIGGGVLWKLNFASKSAEPQSVLFRQTKPGQLETQLMGNYWNFYHQDGRTFLIGYGDGQSVYELEKNGAARLWAICGTLPAIAQFPRWTLPKSIADLPAVQALFAQNARQFHANTTLSPTGAWGDRVSLDVRLMQNISILWVDKNGDGIAEPEEFEVLPQGDTFFAPGFGTGSPTLNLNIPAEIGGAFVLLHVTPQGFLPSGAPNYSLKQAVQSAQPLTFRPPGGDGGESIQDSFGREIFNDDPMRSVAANGKDLWTFPNKWVGVHGSQVAPLPQSGEMQGVLYFLGAAPLDNQGDVLVMNGNHGRFFAMTSDGMYLDEFFRDIRVSQETDAYTIGGEPFGGFFDRGDDGNYYLQSGHTDYRIFQLDGLRNLKRSEGTVTVSAEQFKTMQTGLVNRAVQNQEMKFVSVPAIAQDVKVPPDPEQWPLNWTTVQWGDPSQSFPFAQVKILRSENTLHLAYRVKDPSPWKNTGSDWTTLFKTGDSIDFQFSTDLSADPNRTGPVPGDKRLLIAPFQQQAVAVLYSYREANAKSPVTFSSPWRSEVVDRVVRLPGARVSVRLNPGSYEVIAAVPLADLGLPPAGTHATLRGDFGVIYGDPGGTIDQLRSYWSNKATGLVNDVPGEVTVNPKLWGTLDLQAATP